MRGSVQKYLKDIAHEDHGGALSFPGTASGFPVRGSVQHLRQEEYENLPHVLDFKSRKFVLTNDADKEEFEKIMDRIVNGWYSLYKRVDRWCDENGGPIVWLEWLQIYGEAVQGKHPGGINEQSANQQPLV